MLFRSKENNWEAMLDRTAYDKERWIISRTQVNAVEARELMSKRLEVLGGVSDDDFNVSGELKRDILEDVFKKMLLSAGSEILQESGFGITNRGRLYRIMLKHVREKIFGGKILSEAHRDDIEFALDMMPEIQRNFSAPIVAGIIEG